MSYRFWIEQGSKQCLCYDTVLASPEVLMNIEDYSIIPVSICNPYEVKFKEYTSCFLVYMRFLKYVKTIEVWH